MNKNITLSVKKELLDQARIIAAKKQTTVNALVREFLGALSAKENAADDARDALLRLAGENSGDMGTQIWNREKLYDH